MAVTNQPGRYAPSEFQTGLCDFCDDFGTCCYGLCFYPCLGCSIAGDMDECCLCGLTGSIRSVYRTKYNINRRRANDSGSVGQERIETSGLWRKCDFWSSKRHRTTNRSVL
ncbi:Placenta-specific gene 8 protein [Liparis tanakae]|uniref:Placenta-specific gene 8 protein n=1 Tax=Liparis tanakae TaxID=230148 RepID=A0A4Z2HT60_9TELE|nr:Placenta-specific gene 8 protein [Liparis tanakae]